MNQRDLIINGLVNENDHLYLNNAVFHDYVVQRAEALIVEMDLVADGCRVKQGVAEIEARKLERAALPAFLYPHPSHPGFVPRDDR